MTQGRAGTRVGDPFLRLARTGTGIRLILPCRFLESERSSATRSFPQESAPHAEALQLTRKGNKRENSAADDPSMAWAGSRRYQLPSSPTKHVDNKRGKMIVMGNCSRAPYLVVGRTLGDPPVGAFPRYWAPVQPPRATCLRQSRSELHPANKTGGRFFEVWVGKVWLEGEGEGEPQLPRPTALSLFAFCRTRAGMCGSKGVEQQQYIHRHGCRRTANRPIWAAEGPCRRK